MNRAVRPSCMSGSAWRRLRAAALCAALLAVAFSLAPLAHAQNFGLKNVQGKVFGAGDAPVSEAIVYLKNSRNSDIKTYITTQSGAYQFVDLSADTDYTLWAAYKGKKSPAKTVSSFDTRKQVYIDLHIKD